MGLEFLREHAGRRLRNTLPPVDFGDEPDDEGEEQPDLDLESPREQWRPVDTLRRAGADHLLPIRFIDGCHRGQTVAWVQDADGCPVPVMLAEIGGVCMSQHGTLLRRDFDIVERVVTMVVDPFPWHEIETFAVALRGIGLRLLPAEPPEDDLGVKRPSFDFELMRKRTQNRSDYEMATLEELALNQDPHRPSLVDGRLEPRVRGEELRKAAVVGVIKTHRENYLHAQGWRTFYDLAPGQRTPAFRLPSKGLPVVSWYLRLTGGDHDGPAWGVVRVEITETFFQSLTDPWVYLDALSAWLVELRCRRGDYTRATISLEPIVQAEESLRALFTPPDQLKWWFYRATGL
jgi:hypothetical protein